jgi:hypothetical protein
VTVHLGLSKMQWCEIGKGPICKLTETYDVDETCELCLENVITYGSAIYGSHCIYCMLITL